MYIAVTNGTEKRMESKLKILYAEDNRITAQETTEALEENGYKVQTVYDGDEAWLTFQESPADIVLLDYEMPGKTGIEVFLLIRNISPDTPVLILSSYTEYCVLALKIGTADFIRKDGGIEEACARIEAAWQRKTGGSEIPERHTEIYHLSPFCSFHTQYSRLDIGDRIYPLNGMLAEVLNILCQNKGLYVSKRAICKRLWNNDSQTKINLLRDYISKLRRIFKADPNIEILSSYGKGYCLKVPD